LSLTKRGQNRNDSLVSQYKFDLELGKVYRRLNGKGTHTEKQKKFDPGHGEKRCKVNDRSVRGQIGASRGIEKDKRDAGEKQDHNGEILRLESVSPSRN